MEEREFKPACRGYEDRLETALEGRADAELAAHLEECAGCRAALDRARQARELLLETQVPTPDPGNWFATRVMARIREEERTRVTSPIWAPIGSLASRLSLGVGMVLILLCAYVYESSPQQVPTANGQAEVTSVFPQQPSHPADKDEVLASLSGANYEY